MKPLMRLGAALTAAALILSACGNGPNDKTALFKQIPTLFQKKQDPAPLTPQQIAQALTATDKPVQMYEIEDRKLQFLMLEIERNGPYQTYGSSSRQVVNQRGGMITSTRGLGGDLMSSEVDSLLSAVRSRSGGSVQYDMRFLTPEDVTQVLRYLCDVRPGGPRAVAGGLVQTTGTVVTADCRNTDSTHSFTNTYVVANDGYILSARQWLGSFLGPVSTQALRR